MTSIASTENPRRRLRILRRPTDSIRPATPRPERRDCHGRLITALLEQAGADCTLASSTLRPWCSATFVGAQHQLTLCMTGVDALEHAHVLAARLGEADLPIKGHIVADVVVDAVRQGEDGAALIDLAVLTIEDW